MKKSFLILLGAIALTACNDDYFEVDDTADYSDMIGYNVKVSASDEFKARGTDDHKYVSVEALEETIGGKSLYLHTVVSDTIPQYVTAAKNGITRPQSRGSITYTGDVTEMNVSAIVINGSSTPQGWPATGESQMYMNNETVTEEYNWTTGRYWPQEQDSIRFYTYTPIDALTLPAISDPATGTNPADSEPSFNFTVDDDITKQVDLLVGSAQYEGNYCKSAQIDMCHALTAVEIKLSNDIGDFTIKNLTITGLKNSGTYTYNYVFSGEGDHTIQKHDAGQWKNVTTQNDGGTYVLYDDNTGIELVPGVECEINTTPNMVLMMMPQDLGEDAKIIVEGYDHVLKKDVDPPLVAKIGGNGKSWNKGEHIVYTLSISSTNIEYYIEATPQTASIPYYGIKDSPYSVKSYKTVTRSGMGTKIFEVPWEAVAIENNVEVAIPAGLQLSATSGLGVNDASKLENYTYCLLPNLGSTDSKSHSNFLNPEQTYFYTSRGTKDVPFDLSTESDYSEDIAPINTANSYIVLAPGYYTFPLVYGNAITSGSVNKSAYTGYGESYTQTIYTTDYSGNQDGNTITVPCKGLANFVDHNNTAISGPWIVNTNTHGEKGRYTPTSAEIVWQDEPCLVTEVKFNEAKDYIQFRVNEETVCDGNAVIAVKDADGTIMWSWHIWVSDGYAYHNQSNSVGGSDLFAQRYVNTAKKTDKIIMANRRVVSANWKDCTWKDKNDESTYTGADFHMSRVFLGHCDGELKQYKARDIKIRFKQVESDDAEYKGTPKSCDVIFKQDAGTVSTVNNIPYYQYGRKDPMLPTGEKNADKIYYDNDWKPHYSIVYKAEQASLGKAIQNPEKFYAQQSRTVSNNLRNYNWCSDGTYMNLWNTKSWSVPAFAYHSNFTDGKRAEFHAWFNNLIESGVTKSVYDPCPPGYELPRADAYTGASFHGMNIYPLWYEGTYSESLFAFKYNGGSYTQYSEFGYHIYGNVWLNPWGNPYYVCAENFNAISIYATPMVEAGSRGLSTAEYDGESLPVPFFGHRNNEGKVAKYGEFASALTCAPYCTHSMNSSTSSMESFAQYMLLRLCVIKSADTKFIPGTMIPYSLRTFSGSDFDLAFGIIPAKSGANPTTMTVNATPDASWWGDGNKSDYNISF